MKNNNCKIQRSKLGKEESRRWLLKCSTLKRIDGPISSQCLCSMRICEQRLNAYALFNLKNAFFAGEKNASFTSSIQVSHEKSPKDILYHFEERSGNSIVFLDIRRFILKHFYRFVICKCHYRIVVSVGTDVSTRLWERINKYLLKREVRKFVHITSTIKSSLRKFLTFVHQNSIIKI